MHSRKHVIKSEYSTGNTIQALHRLIIINVISTILSPALQKVRTSSSHSSSVEFQPSSNISHFITWRETWSQGHQPWKVSYVSWVQQVRIITVPQKNNYAKTTKLLLWHDVVNLLVCDNMSCLQLQYLWFALQSTAICHCFMQSYHNLIDDPLNKKNRTHQVYT